MNTLSKFFSSKIITINLLLVILFLCSANAQTWEKINPSFPLQDTLLQIANFKFVNKNIGWVITSGTIAPSTYKIKMFETTNGGFNWTLKRNLGDGISTYVSYSLDTNNIWFMGIIGHLIFTNNAGITWNTSRVINYYSGYYFTGLHFFSSSTGIAFNNYRWFTTDGGYTWAKGVDSNVTFPSPTDVDFVNERLGWMVGGSSVFRSDGGYIANTIDGGKNWQYQDSTTAIMHGVNFVDSLKGFAVGNNFKFTTGFIYSTIDGGKDWNRQQFLTTGPFWDIGFLDDKNGWIAGSGKILKTTDGGTTWKIQMDGLDSEFKKLMILKKDKVAYVFGDDYNNITHTLLRADLSNLTEVKKKKEDLLKDFYLAQNFPNPFNPITHFQFSIADSRYVTVKIYDVLGKEIAELVNEKMDPGTHTVEWNAGKISSGVYLVRLQAGNFSAMRKVVLIR